MLSLYRSELLIRFGNFMFRYRNMIFPAALVLIVILPAGKFWGDQWFDPWLDRAALLLALVGESLRVLTVGLEYIKRGGLNKRVYANRLVTEGMFSVCRNPLYLGNLLMALALFIISARFTTIVLGGALVGVTYIAIVAAEEQYLRAAFPKDYDAYCRTTNRWFPDVRRLGDALRNSHFKWRRVLLKESSSFYVWILAALVLDGLENGFSFAQRDMRFTSAVFLAATAAFVTIQIFKRTGRLKIEQTPQPSVPSE